MFPAAPSPIPASARHARPSRSSSGRARVPMQIVSCGMRGPPSRSPSRIPRTAVLIPILHPPTTCRDRDAPAHARGGHLSHLEPIDESRYNSIQLTLESYAIRHPQPKPSLSPPSPGAVPGRDPPIAMIPPRSPIKSLNTYIVCIAPLRRSAWCIGVYTLVVLVSLRALGFESRC